MTILDKGSIAILDFNHQIYVKGFYTFKNDEESNTFEYYEEEGYNN